MNHFLHENIKVGHNFENGYYTVVHEGVTIGDDVTLGDHTVILPHVEIGDGVTIGSHCVIGKRPASNQRMKRKSDSVRPLKIGANTTIGCSCVLYAGSEIGKDVFIGDLASIREKVQVGETTVIGRSVHIELHTMIGSNVVLQTGCYVTGDTVIENNVFVGPCVSMSNDKYMGKRTIAYGGPTICEGAAIGNNATLLPGITIGRESIVGAGAVVTKHVPAQSVYVGNPAKSITQK
ncbi:acyltransferase [Longirhabdus pacifica]|uniref:acyltransferase n=1 Tax=Longirhabdus pacifica TaxID=2305227 RepID=UPI001008DEAE|nr:N-acetyltransferase [Longirhabdus pacifica]